MGEYAEYGFDQQMPIIDRVRGPYRKLRTRFFSILMAQARSARAMRKKRGSVTYGTDRANDGSSFFFFKVELTSNLY